MRLFIILILLTANMAVASMENQLQHHASPYLAMHGHDPVAWQEWNQDSVNRARNEGKLLYVSSGYFSCHWCHVMQRESYQNREVAQLLNENFIPVKVDREINGALDSRLIDFVERTQGRAGWPLNVFITPDGYPLVGMTYVPVSDFIKVLTNLKIKWKNERGLLDKIAIDATTELEATTKENHITQKNTNEYINQFLAQAIAMADELSGGFGEQNKFPSVPQLTVMLEIYKTNQDKNLKRFLILTLERMASQGLYDQLGGGFFRYVIDPTWQIPHFEKMLYDNALLAILYIQASVILENKYFEEIAKQTLAFMLSDLHLPGGGYVASLSALDAKGIEGGYYLWQQDALQKHLTKDEFDLLKLVWGLNGASESGAGHHLVQVMTLTEAEKRLNFKNEKVQELYASAKLKMLKLRNQRELPRDEKILAGWNGLVLSALTQAAKTYDDTKYAEAARELKNYLYQYMWHNNELYLGMKKNKSLGVGELKDYAYIIKGLSDWLEYEPDKKDRAWLKRLIETAWTQYYTKNGWLLSQGALLKYKQNTAVVIDDVLPSSSAILITSTFKNTPDVRVLNFAKEALTLTPPELLEQPFWYASHIFAVHTYLNHD